MAKNKQKKQKIKSPSSLATFLSSALWSHYETYSKGFLDRTVETDDIDFRQVAEFIQDILDNHIEPTKKSSSNEKLSQELTDLIFADFGENELEWPEDTCRDTIRCFLESKFGNSKVLEDIKKEAERATQEHGPMNSLHEAYAVILEEVDEFWDEVKKKTKNRDKKNIRAELVQIAAMCVKTIEGLKL